MLERFAYINNAIVKEPPNKPREDIKEVIPLILPSNMRNITLADQSPISKNYVTAHKLSDYRRKNSSILLVPNVEATIDIFLFSRDEVAECAITL